MDIYLEPDGNAHASETVLCQYSPWFSDDNSQAGSDVDVPEPPLDMASTAYAHVPLLTLSEEVSCLALVGSTEPSRHPHPQFESVVKILFCEENLESWKVLVSFQQDVRAC